MPADVALLREWLNRITTAPLEPDDDRYVALLEGGRGAVDTVFSTIDLRDNRTTAQLLAGPRGSGKPPSCSG